MSMSNGLAEEEGTENIAAVHEEAHEPTDIIQNAFQQLKTYIDSRLEDLTKTLQPKAKGSAEPNLFWQQGNCNGKLRHRNCDTKPTRDSSSTTQRSKTMC